MQQIIRLNDDVDNLNRMLYVQPVLQVENGFLVI